jgi:hypothetical protein
MIFAAIQRISLLLLTTALASCLTPQAHAQLANTKGLFLEQLESPASKINTGLKYWILLNENGKLRSVNSLHLFKNGDKIRFRMLPNINGYAYVVMVEGTSGKSKLLFPLSNKSKAQVLAGKQYTMPAQGYFQFDDKPGIEKLRVVVSRQPQPLESLLQNKTEQKIVVIAQSSAPDSIIEDEKESTISAVGKAEETPLEFTTIPEGAEDSVLDYSKDLNYVPPGVSKPRQRIRRAARPVKIARTKLPPKHIQKLIQKRKPSTAPRQVMATTPADCVTVINTNPKLNLWAEIELRHTN